MKKLFALLFISSLALNVYLINTEVVFEETVSDSIESNYRAIPRQVIEEDKVELAQAALKKSSDCNESKNINAQVQSDQPEKAEVREEWQFNEEEFQQESQAFYEKANKKIAEFLEYNVGLTLDQIDMYYRLRQQRQEEVDAFVKGRFDEMEKNGAKHLFLSLEDTVEMGKINQKYLERFKNNIGADAYEMYQDFKKRLNTQSTDNNKFAFFIDF